MRFIANIIWLVCGGFTSAIGYLTGSIGLALTIIGLPLAWQTFRLGILCLWPFGASVKENPESSGCLTLLLNIVWFVCGGWWTMLSHLFFGVLLCITIVGIPWGKQHFKMAGFALRPFGKEVILQ